jgi:hypothetical protein
MRQGGENPRLSRSRVDVNTNETGKWRQAIPHAGRWSRIIISNHTLNPNFLDAMTELARRLGTNIRGGKQVFSQ